LSQKIKDSVAIDTEATGLKIPERDKLSLIQLCDASGNVYVIQPDKKNLIKQPKFSINTRR